MVYLVVEIQKTGEDQVSNIVTSHQTLNEAKSKLHQVLAAAAVSEVPVHSAVLISEEGIPMRNECFRHTEEIE